MVRVKRGAALGRRRFVMVWLLLPGMVAAHSSGVAQGNALLHRGVALTAVTPAGQCSCVFCACTHSGPVQLGVVHPYPELLRAWHQPRLAFTSRRSAVPVVGKLHLDKAGVGREGSLGLSVNLLRGHTHKLSLYADANWADLFNDASLQNIVAHIGLRYQFL